MPKYRAQRDAPDLQNYVNIHNSMKIRTAILVALDSWYLRSPKKFVVKSNYPDLEKAHKSWLKLGADNEDFETWLNLYSSDINYRSFRIARNERKVPQFWSDKVINAYLDTTVSPDYLTWHALMTLRPESIPNLIAIQKNKKDCDRQYEDLFNAMLPICSGEHVDIPTKEWKRAASILYLEPEEPLPFNWNYSNESNIKDVAEEVLTFIGQSGTGAQPHLLFDSLILHGLCNTVPMSLTIISLSPLPKRTMKDSIELPSIVRDVTSYLECFHTIKHLIKRVQDLPFHKCEVPEYLESLSSREQTESYELTFLKDREVTLRETKRINRTMKSWKKWLKDNKFSEYSLSINTSTTDKYVDAFRRDVLNTLTDKVQEAHSLLSESLTEVAKSENALADYLRDKAIAESTQANLSLQKKIRSLTRVAIVISILALFLGIIPDEVKKKVYELLTRITLFIISIF